MDGSCTHLTGCRVTTAADLKLVDHIETLANPKGLCALCPNLSNTVLACPGVTRGTVRIELYDLRKTTLITAHEAELSQVNIFASPKAFRS